MTDPTTDAAKLLPCPFCNSEAKIERHYRAMPYDPHDGLGYSGGGVVDETPYCQNKFCRASRPSVEAWNTRPQPAPSFQPRQPRRDDTVSLTTSATPTCMHCGSLTPHTGQCPKIKAVEYYENGTVKRVEYFTATELLGLPSIPVMPVGEPRKVGGNQW